MKFAALLLLLVVLIGLAGCAPVPSAQPAATEAPATVAPPPAATATPSAAPTATAPAMATGAATASPTTAATATQTVPPTAAPGLTAEPTVPAGFTTYRDAAAGFAIDYPAGWSITAPPVEIRPQAQAYTASLRSDPQSSVHPGGQPIAPGETGIDVTVVRTSAATLDEALAERRAEILSSELGVTITEEFEVELPGGLRAVRRQLDTAQVGTVAELTTFLNGKRIMVTGMGNLDRFDMIARSLRPIPQGGSGESPATPTGTPGAGTTYSDAELGFSLAVPAGWRLCQDSGFSRLFCRVPAPSGPVFPRFYVTLLPPGFTNADASAYNFMSEADVAALTALAAGQSYTTAGTPGYSTFARLPDIVVDERPAVVVENAKVWEGGPGTKDRRVLVKVATGTYMFGTYYQTAEELAEFENALEGVRISAQ
ncbi:MAG: hypothetical protein ACM30E_08070 [Nitrososphaerales archaeon]